MYNNQAVKGGYYIRPVLFCGKISAKQRITLEEMGYSLCLLPPFSLLDKRVNTHADMLLFPTEKGFLLHRTYYEENAAFFDALPLTYTLTDEAMGKEHPLDTRFNALPMGEVLFCGKAVSEKAKALFQNTVTVKQGYVRCSAALVGKGVITSDKSLYKALLQEGVDTLLVSQKGISLEGYGEGCIGGASLTLSEHLTAFFGNLENHPDYKAMADFANRQNATLLSLSEEPLCDVGGGFLKEIYD